MTVIHLTREDVQQAMADVVAEKGADFHYASPPFDFDGNRARIGGNGVCRYVHNHVLRGDDQETLLEYGCIVGAALNKLGVPLDAMSRLENESAAGRYGGLRVTHLLPLLRDENVITYTPDVTFFLNRAQLAQDAGDTWGQALTSASQSF